MGGETLHGLLARTVAAHPGSPAVTDKNGTLDYAAFSARVDGYAGLLADKGIGRGDHVGLFLPDTADYLALIFACARIGALAVHINTRFRKEELGHVLRRARPRVLIVDWTFEHADVPQLLAELTDDDLAGIEVVIDAAAQASSMRGIPVVALGPRKASGIVGQPDDPAITFTTSGSTGGPKLAVHTQRSIALRAVDAARVFAVDSASISLQILPLCGAAGHGLAMASVSAGAHIVCAGRYDPAHVDKLIRRHRITHSCGTDFILEQLAVATDGHKHTTLKSFIFAPFGPNALKSIEMAAEAGLAPRWTYGSSEAQAFVLANTPRCKFRFSGEPVGADTTVELRDPETGAAVSEGAGVLHVKGASVFIGYLNDPEASERVRTADGFFVTGDLMNREQVGFSFGTRVSETLRLGGFLVNPEEIESIVAACDGVNEAVVVAVDVAQRATPVAFVTLREGAAFSEQACIDLCRARVASYKVPARVIVIDKLPLIEGPNGHKVHRPTLRTMATQHVAEEGGQLSSAAPGA